MVEHFLGKEEVTSSSLVNSSENQEVASIATSFFVPFQERKKGKKGLPGANVTHNVTHKVLTSRVVCPIRKHMRIKAPQYTLDLQGNKSP